MSEIEQEIRKQFAPISADFFRGSAGFKLLQKHASEFDEKLGGAFELIEAFKQLITVSEIGSKHISKKDLRKSRKSFVLMEALLYLMLVEVLGNFVVNLTLLLLIAKGHDLHLGPDRRHAYMRHATSLEDLDSPTLTLSVKLDYLDLNKMVFFSKMIDRDLRNKIAHLEFTVNEKGEFLLQKRGKTRKIDVGKKIDFFMDCLDVVTEVLKEQMGRNISKNKP